MPEEIDEGVAYLKALRQSTPGGAAAAPAREPGLPPASPVTDLSEGFKGSEKRRSPRYKCEGSVSMSEEGCEVRTWASFTDVSMHGCYVEAQATYPVGTTLLLQLEARGLRIVTKGNVRVSYPYLGMGIAFIEMSEENQSRLREMLNVVSQPNVLMGPGISSSLPASGALKLPPISNAGAAVEALREFFQNHQILMRDDFVRIVKKTQG